MGLRGLGVLACAACGVAASAVPGDTVRVSLDSVGVQGNEFSYGPTISADGRFVAFRSSASNLVPGDTNGTYDTFVTDLQTGATTRASIDSAGVQGNGFSYAQSLSADGRFVAFNSDSTNLVAGDTNRRDDIFVRDVTLGTTTRVSVDSTGAQGNASSDWPSISADGRFVVFYSAASNLVAGDTNDVQDIFLRDRQFGTTIRVSFDSAGAQGNDASYSPSLSADGRFVAFESRASNLVTGDTNASRDIFVRDLTLSTTTRVSVTSVGAQGNGLSYAPSLSADGRFVAFRSEASTLVAGDTNGRPDIFVRDLTLGITTRVSVDSAGTQANSDSERPSISADGRFVAFDSFASNLVAGDTNSRWDIFVRDLMLGTTTRVSAHSAGAQANGGSYWPALSADARFVAFSSDASNLVTGDTNAYEDVFRHELVVPAGPVKLKLDFDSWTGASLPATADYALRKADGTPVSSGTVAVAANGMIEIPKPAAGDYELLVKSSGFLRKKVAFTQGASTVDLGTVSLVNGDIDGDNAVTVFDYDALSAAFDSAPGDANWNPAADLDGDLAVTVFDYDILSQNFDRQGDE